MEIPISCTERSSDDNERLEAFQTKKKQIESILHFALNQNWLCAFASTMSSAHNAPYGPGCWHSLNGRSHRKSSLVFKDLGMALQKCHLSMPSLSRIARKIPGNRLWNCRAQFSQAKTAQQHLPAGTVKNEKLELLMEPQNIPFHDSLSGYWSSPSDVTNFSDTLLYQVCHKYECKQAINPDTYFQSVWNTWKQPTNFYYCAVQTRSHRAPFMLIAVQLHPGGVQICAILGPGPYFWAH